MAKNAYGVKKTSSGSSKAAKSSKSTPQTPSNLNLSDPKVQSAVLVALLAILVLALWYGFTHSCLGRRRRRRQSSCCQ